MASKSLNEWLDDYAKDHQNPTNQMIHKICVPLIFLSIVGMLNLIPWQFANFPLGKSLMLVVWGWYIALGLRVFTVMLLQFVTAIVLCSLLNQYSNPFWILLGVFTFAWVGQFIGHNIEGKRPSFFKDLQYLLIGPLWVWKRFL